MLKKLYLSLTLLTAFLWLGSGTMWGETLALYSSETTTNSYIPVNGEYIDTGKQLAQFIYPQADIASLAGKNITALEFYSYWYSNVNFGVTFTIKIMEVAKNSYFPSSSPTPKTTTSATTVYTGTLSVDAAKKMSITLATPYECAGNKDLLIEFSAPKGSTAKTCMFYGKSANGQGFYQKIGSKSTTNTKQDFLPRVTFTYETPSSGGSSCAVPTDVTATQNTPVKATLSWTKAEGEDNYQYLYVAKNGTPDWTGITAQNTNSVELEGLTAGAEYDFYVRTYCDSENQSEAIKKTFSTTCPAPTSPVVSSVAQTNATLSWTAAADISNYQYILVGRGDTEDWTSPTLVEGATTASLTGLTAGTKYDVYVRSYYNATTVSSSVKVQFQTPCNAMSVADFVGTFESDAAGSGLMPNCWEAAASYEYNNTTYPYVRNGYSANDGDQWLHFFGGTNTTKNIAVLPVFTEALNTLTVSFYYKNYNTYSGYFSLGYYKNGVFTAYAGASNLERKTTYTYFEMEIPNVAAANGARLAIQYAGGSYSYDAYIDDVVVTVTPSCAKPSVPTITNIVYDGATIDWTEKGSAEAWKVQYSTDNTNWTTANGGENITAHPYNLRGLTTGTPYYVQVISVCGGTDGESPAVAAASTFTPTCQTPGVPTISEKNTSSAKIGWTVNSGEAEWNLQYSANGGSSWTTIEGVTENPYTLTGLSSGTTYQVRVAATCNGSYTSAATFLTDAIPVEVGTSWSDDFEGESCNWGLINGTLTNAWVWGTAAHNGTGTHALYISNNGGTSNAYSTGSSTMVYATKLLTFTEGKFNFSFDWLANGEANYDYLRVALIPSSVSLTAGETAPSGFSKNTLPTGWIALDGGSQLSAKNTWQNKNVTLDIAAGNYYLVLAWRNDNSTGSNPPAAIDNIAIVAPSCAAPSEVAADASSITKNSASINWTKGAGETSWKLQYKAATDENWTAANEGNAFSTKPFALEGLTPNTTYYVQVKAVCGGTDGESDWSTSGEFETDCNAIALADFGTEEFGSTLPDCWRMTTVGDKKWEASSSTTYRHSASYSWAYSAYTSAENYADLITPAIVLSEDALLKFYVSNYAYSGSAVTAEVYIKYGSTTKKIFDIPTITTGYTPVQQEVDLHEYTGETAKFIFRAHGNGQTSYKSIYIDDVEVKAKPCDAPTALQKVESSSSVVLSWTDEAADKWTLRWREEGAAEWNNVTNLTAKNLTLSTGLAFNKTYEAQVQAVCSDTKSSDWSSLISFGLVCGAAPSNLTVARSTNSATLTWEGVESAFKLETSQNGEDWSEAIDVNAKTYNWIGLTAGQTYYVRVQNACGGAYASTSFKTWCGLADAAELPLSEDFSSALPACWETVSTSDYPKVEAEQLSFVGNTEQMVVFPGYDIDLDKLTVKFSYYNGYARLKLGYLATAGGDFNELVVLPDKYSMFEYELDLATISAAEGKKGYLAVVYYNATQTYYNGAIDNVYIRKTPTCKVPGTPTVTPGVGSASISWNAGASEENAWNLQYKKASDTSWSENIEISETPSYNLDGLEQGVSYKVRVQAACVNDDPSDWSNEVAFTTDCGAITAIPFEETFDEALSACWKTYTEKSGYEPGLSSDGLHIPGGKSDRGNIVVMPQVTANLANATLSITYKCSKNTSMSTYAVPQIGYMTDPDDASTFNEIQTLPQSAVLTTERISLAAYSNVYLAIRYDDATSEGDLYVSELRISHVEIFDDAAESGVQSRINALEGQMIDFIMNRPMQFNGAYNTLCLPFDISAEQLADENHPLYNNTVKVFDYAVVDDAEDELQLAITGASSIEAGVPCFVKYDGAAGADKNAFLFKDVTIKKDLTPTEDGNVAYRGIYEPIAVTAETANGPHHYVFVGGNNQLYWPSENRTMRGFRAYFYINSNELNGSPIKHGMPVRIVERPKVSTGIENTNVENVTLKFIENGQVVIIRNGVKYNIQGQVISK